MDRFRYISSVTSALLFILLVSAALGQRKAPASENHFDRIRERMDWFYHQRAFPLKHIPPGARENKGEVVIIEVKYTIANREARRQ